MSKLEPTTGAFSVKAIKGYWRQLIGALITAIVLGGGSIGITTCNKWKAAYDKLAFKEALRDLGVSPRNVATPNQPVEISKEELDAHLKMMKQENYGNKVKFEEDKGENNE